MDRILYSYELYVSVGPELICKVLLCTRNTPLIFMMLYEMALLGL